MYKDREKEERESATKHCWKMEKQQRQGWREDRKRPAMETADYT
jgi:hypothetical protein